jgi:hypothetical protein
MRTESHKPPRSGLHIRGARGHPVVHRSFIRFARWLRTQYDFPIRVPVYLFPSEYIITMHGERVVASFFAPWRRDVEPMIRIATGDYPSLRRQIGRDHALAAFLNSFAHEVVHYQQWIATGEISERGVVRRAGSIVDAYARTVAHP